MHGSACPDPIQPVSCFHTELNLLNPPAHTSKTCVIFLDVTEKEGYTHNNTCCAGEVHMDTSAVLKRQDVKQRSWRNRR